MKKKIDFLFLLVLAVGSFFITMLFALYSADPLHDGIMLKTAMDVANGKALYKESFSQYGYLVTLIQATFVKAFGEHLWAVHAATAFMYTISYCVVFLITKRYMSSGCAFSICLCILAVAHFYCADFLPWSNVFGLCFLICCLYSTLRFIETRKKRYIVLMAVWASFAFWSKLPIGAVVYLALFLLFAIFLLIRQYKKEWKEYIGIFLISSLIVFGIFLVILFLQGALNDWWIQTMKGAVDFAVGRSTQSLAEDETISSSMIFIHKIYSILRKVLGDLFSYSYSPIDCMVPILNLIIFSVYLVRIIRQAIEKRRIAKIDVELLCFAMFALASWSQYYPVPCDRHIFWGKFPMIALMGVGLYRLFTIVSNKHKNLAGVYTIIIVLIIQFPIVRENVINGYAKLTSPTYYVEDSPYHYLDGIRMDKEEAIFFSEVESTLYSLELRYPEKELLNISGYTLFSCYSDVNIGQLYSPYGRGMYSGYAEEWNCFIKDMQPIILYDGSNNAIDVDDFQLVRFIEGDIGSDIVAGSVGVYLTE